MFLFPLRIRGTGTFTSSKIEWAPNPNGIPFSKLRLELLDTQVYIGVREKWVQLEISEGYMDGWFLMLNVGKYTIVPWILWE